MTSTGRTDDWPRALLVGMVHGVHLARWVAQFAGSGWDLHLFPETATAAAPDLGGITVWDWSPRLHADPGRDLVVRNPLFPHERLALEAGWEPDRRTVLARLLHRLRPQIFHTLEFQHAGYLAVESWERMRVRPAPAPVWIASNYGSDIHLFGRLTQHQDRIRSLLRLVDVHHCECARDLEHGRRFGFAGVDAPLVPMGGGWDLDAVSVHRDGGPTSQRRTIALKAYDGWAGRASVAFDALHRCGDLLAGYTLVLYRCNDGMWARAQLLSAETGCRIERVSTLNAEADYHQVLEAHGRARVSIGLSISDAISTSLLEAMVMGSFPIQSDTGCGNEWIESGANGILVPPEDPDVVAAAIRRALTDDDLVDRAAAINERIARERLDINIVREQALGIYDAALALRERSGMRGG